MPKKGAKQGKGGGPKTETGKRNSRGNATKHGLCSSNSVILPDEKLSDYEAVQQDSRKEFAPEGESTIERRQFCRVANECS